MNASKLIEKLDQPSWPTTNIDIYVSCSKKDHDLFKNIILPILVDIQKESGYTYWFDETNLRAINDKKCEIERLIENSCVFLTFQSKNSLKTDEQEQEKHLKWERRMAREKHDKNSHSRSNDYFILPVAEGAQDEILPSFCSDIQHLDIHEKTFAAHLKENIKKIVNNKKKNEYEEQYIGLSSYTEANAHHFWGRDYDIERIAAFIQNNITTFLFGASGCGKTSLLRAGITPTLKRDNYHSIYITPRTASNEIDKTNLWKLITSKIDKMVERLLLTPVPKHNDVEWSKAKLWEKLYLFDYKDEYETDHHFLIIIDQFEEIFQINNSLKDIRDLFTGYELLCGYYKDSIIIQNINHKDYLTGEYFVKYKYKNINISHRLVLSLRRDFMYEMESHSDDFPILSKNRICLNPLNEEQAAEIITSSKSPDGKKWFSMEEAKSIIRDLSGRSDFEFDGIPEIEIDAMILSLYMKETCDSKLKLQDNTISKEYIDASSVIQSYYSRHMTHPGVENLESLLVTLDGFRKPITKSEAENYIPEDILNKYIELGILKTYMHRNIKWVELSHDKLCSCAAHRISVAKAKELNRKIISPYLYLLPQGRLQFSNSFYDEFRQDYKKSFTFAKWLSFIQRRGIIDPQIDMNLSGLYLNSDAANDCTLSLKLNNASAGACYTDDGIEEIIVKLAKDKLYSVSYRRDNKAYAIYDGVHKIEFYYDTDGRLILLDFFDINNDRLWNDKCFTSILFEYRTSSEMPSHTYYLDIPQSKGITEIANPKDESFGTKLKQFKTKHLEGNYGYASTYNEYDLEISRLFLDESDNEITLPRGYSELRFEVYQTGAIQSYSYFCRSEKVEIEGIHKVKLIYANDKFSEPPTHEFYYDINDLPAESNDWTYGTELHLKKHCICITNLDEEGKPCSDKRGISHQLIYLNKHKQLECCFSFDLISKTENINEALKEIVYFNNYPDSKIRYEIDLDNNLNIKNIARISFNSTKRLCRMVSYDAQLRITSSYDIQHDKNSEFWTQRTPQDEPINSVKRVRISDTLSIYISSDGSKEANETDANGNIIRTYKCDNFNNQIHDNNGSWETRYEYESHNKELKTKELYYSQNGEPFEIQPGVFGYAWKYAPPANPIVLSVDDSDVVPSSLTPVKRKYYLNSRGEPVLNCVKYCYEKDILDNYAFYDESQHVVIKTSRDGVHARITHKISDNKYEVSHYNTRGELCNCSGGWAKFLIESNGAESNVVQRLFYDAHNEPVNGPFGWHQGKEIFVSYPGDNPFPYSSYEYLDIDNNLIDDNEGAQSKIGKLSLYDKLSLIIKNELSYKYLFDDVFSQKVINANRELLKSAFIIYRKNYSRLIYQPRKLSSQASSDKAIYTLHALKSETGVKGMECIIVAQVPDRPILTCMERDVIIQFGEWHLFDYIDEFSINYKTPSSSYLMLDDFERTFNSYHVNENVFTLKFARLSENNQWQVYSVEIAMRAGTPSIGRIVNKKISRIAYREIFSTYKMKINEPTKHNDSIDLVDIDLVDIVTRVKELQQNSSKMLPCNNEITPE